MGKMTTARWIAYPVFGLSMALIGCSSSDTSGGAGSAGAGGSSGVGGSSGTGGNGGSAVVDGGSDGGKAAGEECSQNAECASGFCTLGSSTNKNCAAVEGEACGGTTGVFCGKNLYCDIILGKSGNCVRSLAQGDSCKSTFQCPSDPVVLICTSGSSASTCQPGIDKDKPCDPAASACFLSYLCDPVSKTCVCDNPDAAYCQ